MITLKKKNNTYFKVECEDDIALELYYHFTYFAASYKFHPMFKSRRWDGKLRFFNMTNRIIYIGLIEELVKFANKRKYELILSDCAIEAFSNKHFNKEYFAKFVQNLNMTAYGEKIQFRDFQLYGAYEAIKRKRRVFSSATGTGKSAIQYLIIRLLQEMVPGKILLIVPSTNLVEQMYNDFKDYASNDPEWVVGENCARLYSGYKYDNSKQILISTWQSLQNKEPDWFTQFDGVICDETHQAKAKQIKTIVESCSNAEYRFGFTGTVPKDQSERSTIVGLFGPVNVLQTAKQAMDSGYISELDIQCIALKYSKETLRNVKKGNYQDEISSICGLDERNQFIKKLAINLNSNTLILTARIESHGKILYKLIKDAVKDNRKVFYIFGEVDTKTREEIRSITENESNAIIVASYGCVSTGWSVRNLHNVIFAFPSKSFTRVIQSIGRGLRLSENKSHCTLFDIADNMTEKNFSWIHFIERLKLYAEQEFKFKIEEINI